MDEKESKLNFKDSYYCFHFNIYRIIKLSEIYLSEKLKIYKQILERNNLNNCSWKVENTEIFTLNELLDKIRFSFLYISEYADIPENLRTCLKNLSKR